MANISVTGPRRVLHRILMIVAVPFLVLGLIDPLEGGLALLIALGIYLVAFIAGRSKPARFLWIPYTISILVGALVLAYAVWLNSSGEDLRSFPLALRVGLTIYEASVLVTIGAGVFAAVRTFRR